MARRLFSGVAVFRVDPCSSTQLVLKRSLYVKPIELYKNIVLHKQAETALKLLKR